ncbi:MAG: cation:proton antiporter [Euryarchaeota archaeon]|nr:cation:proton antiporter [Euryarchaeota archaeon]
MAFKGGEPFAAPVAGTLVYGVAGIIILGIASHWLAWRVRVAPILLFLAVGFIAGPMTGFLDPDTMLGDLLSPIVSLGVAVILFEGGMSLRAREVRKTGAVVGHLVTVGVLITWILSAIAAHLLLDLSVSLALLLGSIVVVSGPTVVGPLLRHVRPRGAVGPVLKWEGIVIDPVGALLAILVFDAIILGDPGAAALSTLLSVLSAVFVGSVLGVVGAALLVLGLHRFWIPDFLQSAVTLMLVLLAFVGANAVQSESGLLAVTLMGIVLANQRFVDLERIIEFKETLRVLIIPALFILLTARLELGDLAVVGGASLAFLGFLILVVRPVTVALATRGTDLSLRERIFVAGLMPRGIVAAAIASVFAIRLADRGLTEADLLVPYTFLVIFGTGIVYSLASRPLGHLLGVAQKGAGDVLIVGANLFARQVAKALGRAGIGVLLIDTNRSNVTQANVEDLNARRCNALSDRIEEEIELERITQVLVLTPNDETNMLAALHLGDYVDRAEAYQLPMTERKEPVGTPARRLAGRMLFGSRWSYARLHDHLRSGWVVKTTKITEEFDWEDYKRLYGDDFVPLFLVYEGRAWPFTSAHWPTPEPETIIISLAREDESVEAVPQERISS